MDQKTATRLLQAALVQLLDAARRLENLETDPKVPRPRPRTFYFGAGWRWPSRKHGVAWDTAERWDGGHVGGILGLYWLAPSLWNDLGGQPRRVLRALRRIQAATAWCEARMEGMRQAAAEIVRQQQAAEDALQAEAALQALKEGAPRT